VPGRLRMLYVGRFVSFKGMGLGLRALAALRERGIDARLSMIGQGPRQADWRALAQSLGVDGAVDWIPWMRQDELLRTYADYDLLLFPSLNDSSGNVVLEALAGGLPVVCLGLGGPAQIVDEGCGKVVPVGGLTEMQVIAALADALEQIALDPALAVRLRDGAVARARRFAWSDVVARVWGPQGRAYRLLRPEPQAGAA